MTDRLWPLALPALTIGLIILGLALLAVTPFVWVAWPAGGME